MVLLKDYICEMEEAALSLNIAKRKFYDTISKEISNILKGYLAAKRNKVLKDLSQEEVKAADNPVKCFQAILAKAKVIPPNPIKTKLP